LNNCNNFSITLKLFYPLLIFFFLFATAGLFPFEDFSTLDPHQYFELFQDLLLHPLCCFLGAFMLSSTSIANG